MQIRNRLNKLMALNRGVAREYRFEASAGAEEATIYLYDIIGVDWMTGEGVSAMRFAADVLRAKQLGVKALHLRVNSPGGCVAEARAMVTAVRESGMYVVSHIDGVAASAASYLATSADKTIISDGAFLMIHNSWAQVVGDKNDIRKEADVLDKIDSSIADEYSRITNLDREQIISMMDDETWFTAAEALAVGFANEIGAVGKEKKNSSQWNLSVYDKAPEGLPPEDPQPEELPAADHAVMHGERMRRMQVAMI